jgi:outer membrane protein insertion porin family
VRLAPDAHVRSVKYHFIGSHELSASELSTQVATHAPGGFNSVKRAFGWLPLVPDEEKVPFSPRLLQEDLARLRRFYARQGFPEAELDYDVRTDDRGRRVDVTFGVREGRPIRLRSVEIVNADSAGTWSGDPELAAEGRKAAQQLGEKNRGIRFGDAEARSIEANATAWLADHGYLMPRVESATVVDSAQLLVDFKLRITTGPRARVGRVDVQGVHSVPEPIVTRNLPFTTGDWVSTSALTRGQQQLQSVDLFRSATVVMPESLRSEPEVPVDVTIQESRPRFTGVQLGYVTDGAGVSAQGRWTHPNFTGGARSLNVVALVQTGWGNLGTVPEKLARLTLTLRQPYVGNPKLSLSVGPKGELRDDEVERSALG